ncbi:hypothetical protein [Ligilactobacillus equi]
MKVTTFSYRVVNFINRTSILVVSLISFFIIIDINQNIKASTLSSEDTTLITSNNLSNIIESNIAIFTNENGNAQIFIKNPQEVKRAVENAGYSYEDVNTAVNEINIYLEENNIYIKAPGERSTCSKALQFIGYVHSGAYAAAASLLGVTGPAAVIIPIVVGAVYQAGSLFC